MQQQRPTDVSKIAGPLSENDPSTNTLDHR
ncbi:hypothetical protein AERO9AM_10324 [Aeromicrobium sp. 9AM]|nr:hypothetical protein AERO9AM_10324 [Aeromicrobium sp. 9AM]